MSPGQVQPIDEQVSRFFQTETVSDRNSDGCGLIRIAFDHKCFQVHFFRVRDKNVGEFTGESLTPQTLFQNPSDFITALIERMEDQVSCQLSRVSDFDSPDQRIFTQAEPEEKRACFFSSERRLQMFHDFRVRQNPAQSFQIALAERTDGAANGFNQGLRHSRIPPVFCFPHAESRSECTGTVLLSRSPDQGPRQAEHG